MAHNLISPVATVLRFFRNIQNSLIDRSRINLGEFLFSFHCARGEINAFDRRKQVLLFFFSTNLVSVECAARPVASGIGQDLGNIFPQYGPSDSTNISLIRSSR